MNVPTFALTKLANEDTIFESMQVDVVIVRTSDNELATLNIVVLNDLDSVNDCSVSDDEVRLLEPLVSRLVMEPHF